EARRELAKNNPQGRLIDPKEVAAATLWLASSAAHSITGQALPIAGGEVMAG
ncbi:MAG: SDR family oxidoreductase, partial [Rhodoblastus sp.]|nr:SDR family oxidoreductase [Rhodoblastus sp.]